MTFNPNDPLTSIGSEFGIMSTKKIWPEMTLTHERIFRFFSILKLTGLVFWTISFKSLQEKHENRIKNNLNQRKKVENFNLERNLNQLTASMQSIMKPLIRLVLD